MYCKHHTCIVSYRMWCHYLTMNAWLNVINELAVNIQRYCLWSETSRGTVGQPIQHHLLRNERDTKSGKEVYSSVYSSIAPLILIDGHTTYVNIVFMCVIDFVFAVISVFNYVFVRVSVMVVIFVSVIPVVGFFSYHSPCVFGSCHKS